MRLIQMNDRGERDVAVAVAHERRYLVDTAHCDPCCFYIRGRRRRMGRPPEVQLFTISSRTSRDIQDTARHILDTHLRR